MEYQSPLHKKLHDGVFVFTAETTPPDASNKEILLKKIEPLKDIADAIFSMIICRKVTGHILTVDTGHTIGPRIGTGI